jgi:hypothetical protein
MDFPLYKLVIDESSETGVSYVAFVDRPAIEIDWHAFDKAKQRFEITNEEERIVSGLAMVADKPIYRNDNELGEYYVFFDKPTIKQIVLKFFRENNITNVNKEHDPKQLVKGSYLFESFIVDAAQGKTFKDAPDGSWFTSYKVQDEQVWQEIKEGKFNGFSIEGNFIHEKVNSKFNNTNKIMEKIKDLKTLFSEVKKMFTEEEVKFNDVKTSEGAILRIEGELKEGSAVSIVAEDGTVTPAENAEYTLEDGTVITVDAGMISAIKAVDANEAELKAEEERKTAEEKAKTEMAEAMAAEKTELNNRITALETAIQGMIEKQGATFSLIEKIIDTPATEPIEGKKPESTNLLLMLKKVRENKK